MKPNDREIEVVLTEEELDALIKDYPWPRNIAGILHECCTGDEH